MTSTKKRKDTCKARTLMEAVLLAKPRKPKDPLAGLKKIYKTPWRAVRDMDVNGTIYWELLDKNGVRIQYFCHGALARAIAKLGGGK